MQENSFDKIPHGFLKKWQEIADLIANIVDVPAALIMKTENEFMEVFTSSNTENNPYKVGEKEEWYGLYCETVIKSQKKLSIPNALKDKNWDKNPDIKLGMIAYLGYPINLPNQKPFGTLCVLDNKERQFSAENEKLLLQFKKVIEMDLALIFSLELTEKHRHAEIIQELSHYNEEYQATNEELKQANEELLKAKQKAEENEEKFRLMYENTSIGIAAISLDFQIMAANSAYCQMLGYTEKELVGKTLEEITHPEVIDKNIELQEKLKNRESSSYQLEKTFIHKDGHKVYGLLNATLIKDIKNKPLYFLGNVQDITDRKQAKEKVRKSEKKFRDIFNHINDAIFIINLQGNVIEVNDIACNRLGYARDEMLKMKPMDIDTPEYGQYVYDKIQKIEQKGELTFESVHRRKDGYEFSVEVNARFAEYEGESAIISVVRDVTERKKAEEQLKEKIAELEKFNKLMVGRENRMIELKREVNQLLKELGRAEEYSTPDKGENED